MFRFSVRTTIGAAVVGLIFAAAATARAASDAQLIDEANATKAAFLKTDPGMASLFKTSPGYAIFPSIGKGAIGVGGAHGSGVLYEAGQPTGKASLTQVSIGAQLGGQSYSQVIFFETVEAIAHFKQGKTKFSGAVSAVALTAGASANAKYQESVIVFTATRGGLMFEASVGGQKFSYEPFLVMKR
jgi:lipid-binding SYLF domain-containing protein